MDSITCLVLPLAAAALAFAFTPFVARFAMSVGAIDMPGHRKIHNRPIPRLGGLAVVSSIAVTWATVTLVTGRSIPSELGFGIGIGVLPILGISIADDIRPINAWFKLFAHVGASAIAVEYGVCLAPDVHVFGVAVHIGAVAVPLSVLWLVGVTNAFNIIDGLDGLSAGLALISSLSMAAVFALVGQPVMACAALVLGGALAGFLPYNMHPARLFLGDSGATAIGFCLAAFALRGGSTLSSGFAALVPVFILGLPIADTIIAMARRTITRLESRAGGVFVADRNHIHHRLLALGLHHRDAVLILYMAGLAFAGIAFVSMFLKARHAALFIASVLAAGVIGVHRLGYDEFAFIRRGTVLRVYEVPVFKRSMFVVFVDLALVALASYVAVALKLDAWNSAAVAAWALDLSVIFGLLTTFVFWKSGLYRGSWRLAGVADLARVVGAVSGATISGIVLHALLWPEGCPLSVFLIYGFVSLLLFTSSRASYVLLLNSQLRASNQGKPVLVYGAGNRGVAAVRELFDNPERGLRPIGFIDDNPEKIGRFVRGLPVLGTSVDLERLIDTHDVEALLIATSKLPEHALARARSACTAIGVALLRLQVQLEPIFAVSGALEDVSEAVMMDSTAGRNLLQVTSVPLPMQARQKSDWPSTLGSEPCGGCGGSKVHRSHARNVVERLRKSRSLKRLYRCDDCGWRGWLMPLEISTAVQPAGRPEWWVGELDFDTALAPNVAPVLLKVEAAARSGSV
jgi:UDP-GlcNAc:undecaprenyl-phosphate GlcNAc-1-phosphate transferase